MSSILRITILCGLVLVPCLSLAEEMITIRSSSPLSVEAAVQLAVTRNASLDEARHRLTQARARLAASHSANAPMLGLDAQYMRADAPSAYLFKRIDSHELPQVVDFNDPGAFNNVELALSLSYKLFDGGRARTMQKQARLGVAAHERARDIVANELIGATIRVYFDVLAAREFVTAAVRSKQTVGAQLDSVRVRFEHGGALRADVLAIEVRQARVQERLIAARNAVSLAESALRRLLDFPPEAPVDLSGQEWEPAVLPESFLECLAYAKENRPDLGALRTIKAAALAGVDHAESQYKPRLDLQSRYWADDNGGDLEAGRANWSVVAALHFDMYDGGKRDAKRKESRSAVLELKARERALIRGIELQVRKALLDLDEARARFAVAQANVNRSEESLELVANLFKGGAVTVTRFLQSEEDRTSSLVSEIRSRYDVMKAKANVGHAVGACYLCAKGWSGK